MLERIQWLGHSSFCVQGPPLIYIDPVGITRNAFLADAILISQAAYNYCSPMDIQKLLGPETIIIGNDEVAATLTDFNVNVLRPWQCVTLDRTRITVVPQQTESGHSRFDDSANSVGFVISQDYYDLYYAGASNAVPERMTFKPDIAVLPVRNARNGLMAIDEAVEVVQALQPRWVIPSHWNPGSGSGYLDVKAFQTALADYTEVVLPAAAG